MHKFSKHVAFFIHCLLNRCHTGTNYPCHCKKTVPVHHKTERHNHKPDISRVSLSLFFFFLSQLVFLSSVSDCGFEHRNMSSIPALSNSCLVHAAKLKLRVPNHKTHYLYHRVYFAFLLFLSNQMTCFAIWFFE